VSQFVLASVSATGSEKPHFIATGEHGIEKALQIGRF